jgi:phage gp16-like protein
MSIHVASNSFKLRNNELAQIHIAKKDLGLDDDTYRAVLWTVARARSSKELDFHGRKAVIKHFKERGWKNKPATKAKSSRALATDPQSKMIRALWLELHAKGAVNDPSEQALASYIKKRTKPAVEALQWMSSQQASRTIEELKKWLARL